MFRRYRVRITPSGYVFIVITIILSVGAVNTGNNLLYLMSSLLLGLMILSGLTSLNNLLFLEITLRPPGEIFAGLPSRFTLTARRRRGRSFFLTGDHPGGSVHLPSVKGVLVNDLWLTLPERGRARVDTLVLHSGFPLGFFRRFKTCTVGMDVLVYPKPLPPWRASPVVGAEGHEGTRALQGEMGDEIRELRAYRPSDLLRWVDWKATARRGEVVVREFFRVRGDTLVFDLSRKGGNWERRLSEACHLILQGDKNDFFMTLILPDRVLGPDRGEGHRKLMLEALALA
jgi:uncharacterized protein (DUF58 family)